MKNGTLQAVVDIRAKAAFERFATQRKTSTSAMLRKLVADVVLACLKGQTDEERAQELVDNDVVDTVEEAHAFLCKLHDAVQGVSEVPTDAARATALAMQERSAQLERAMASIRKERASC